MCNITHCYCFVDWYLLAGRREQMSMVTAYHDASQVYGSSRKDVDILRAYNGLGRLVCLVDIRTLLL